jgi:chromosome segregation ATPase
MVHDVETLLKQRDQLQAELALADAAATEANEVIECLQDQLAEVQASWDKAAAQLQVLLMSPVTQRIMETFPDA